MANEKRTAAARRAILEILSDGEWRTVRDIKGLLRARGIDVEAAAQRLYELRKLKYGDHNIPCSRRTVPDGRVRYGYQLLSRGAAPPAARPASVPGGHPGERTVLQQHRELAAFVREKLDWGVPRADVEAFVGEDYPFTLDELLKIDEGGDQPAAAEVSTAALRTAERDRDLPRGDRD